MQSAVLKTTKKKKTWNPVCRAVPAIKHTLNNQTKSTIKQHYSIKKIKRKNEEKKGNGCHGRHEQVSPPPSGISRKEKKKKKAPRLV
jgi:hypothetical protein